MSYSTTIDFEGTAISVEFEYQAEELPTKDSPGDNENFEITSIQLEAVNDYTRAIQWIDITDDIIGSPFALWVRQKAYESFRQDNELTATEQRFIDEYEVA